MTQTTLNIPSTEEVCCKNLYWAFKVEEMPKECVYFLGGQIMGDYKQLNKVRLKNYWLVVIQFPSLCS